MDYMVLSYLLAGARCHLYSPAMALWLTSDWVCAADPEYHQGGFGRLSSEFDYPLAPFNDSQWLSQATTLSGEASTQCCLRRSHTHSVIHPLWPCSALLAVHLSIAGRQYSFGGCPGCNAATFLHSLLLLMQVLAASRDHPSCRQPTTSATALSLCPRTMSSLTQARAAPSIHPLGCLLAGLAACQLERTDQDAGVHQQSS